LSKEEEEEEEEEEMKRNEIEGGARSCLEVSSQTEIEVSEHLGFVV